MSDHRVPGIRPRPSAWRQMDTAARHAFPGACTVLLMLLAGAPLGLPAQAQVLPAVVLACVFFWSVFRPGSMPPPLVFALGLLADLLGLAPPGSGILTLLLTYGVAVRWRAVLVRQQFLLVWLAFVAVAAAASLLGYVLTCLLTFTLLPLGAAVFQFTLTAGLYPLLATMFTAAHRSLADPGLA